MGVSRSTGSISMTQDISTNQIESTSDWCENKGYQKLSATLKRFLGIRKGQPQERCMRLASADQACAYPWQVPVKISHRGLTFLVSVRSSGLVALDLRPASRLFCEGVKLVADADPVAFERNGQLHLWAVFESEPDLDTKLRVAGVFQEVFEKHPALRYDFLMITRPEYEWRTSNSR